MLRILLNTDLYISTSTMKKMIFTRPGHWGGGEGGDEESNSERAGEGHHGNLVHCHTQTVMSVAPVILVSSRVAGIDNAVTISTVAHCHGFSATPPMAVDMGGAVCVPQTEHYVGFLSLCVCTQ